MDCDKFKAFIDKMNVDSKKRYGEDFAKGTEKEDEMWYGAYNMVTPGKEGVSWEDMQAGRAVMMTIIKVR
jgi:hypothetical protein